MRPCHSAAHNLDLAPSPVPQSFPSSFAEAVPPRLLTHCSSAQTEFVFPILAEWLRGSRRAARRERVCGMAHSQPAGMADASPVGGKRGAGAADEERLAKRARADAAAGDEDACCVICLDSSPPPIQSGCACRGDAGLAHVACRVKAAESQAPEKTGCVWWECQTCKLITKLTLCEAPASQLRGRSKGREVGLG